MYGDDCLTFALTQTPVSISTHSLDLTAGDGAGLYGGKPVPYDGTTETLECSGTMGRWWGMEMRQCFSGWEDVRGAVSE